MDELLPVSSNEPLSRQHSNVDDELAASLLEARGGACAPSEAATERALCEMGRVERERAALDISRRPRLRTIHLLRGLWTADECAWLLSELRGAAAYHGWQVALSKQPYPLFLPAFADPSPTFADPSPAFADPCLCPSPALARLSLVCPLL